MPKLMYLDESCPAYLTVDTIDCFVTNLHLSIWTKPPVNEGGIDLFFRLPLYIKNLPIRIPESKYGTEWDYGFVDYIEMEEKEVELIKDENCLIFPFTTSELVNYMENWGAGWKFLES